MRAHAREVSLNFSFFSCPRFFFLNRPATRMQPGLRLWATFGLFGHIPVPNVLFSGSVGLAPGPVHRAFGQRPVPIHRCTIRANAGAAAP